MDNVVVIFVSAHICTIPLVLFLYLFSLCWELVVVLTTLSTLWMSECHHENSFVCMIFLQRPSFWLCWCCAICLKNDL